MKIKILNRVWELEFSSRLAKDTDGTCDSPSTPNKKITVRPIKDEKYRLQVLLHEMIHAACWEVFAEEYVDNLSHDFANILWRLGYRRSKDDDK